MRHILTIALMALSAATHAQTTIYPQHFSLTQVQLLDSPLRTAQDNNARLLLSYDADRLMAPFIREAGLDAKTDSPYYGWLTQHPSFSNWGLADWSLEGHVGGHYLSALALAYAAVGEGDLRAQLGERLSYCISILSDCQTAYDADTQGLHGFIGGQPLRSVWTSLYAGNISDFRRYGGWVPLYCQHKVLAGLRDAWLYAGNDTALECFRSLADWTVALTAQLSDADMQTVLGWEHGGVNESMADAYSIFGDDKYLEAACRYSHRQMLQGMATPSATFLDGKHANTQVPKYIGFARIYEADPTQTAYRDASRNFWADVAAHRTTCIGGNSTSEHFFNIVSEAHRYIDDVDGPESCNSNNMLKLSEMLFDQTHDATYADFYEHTMYNHILSSRDPDTGGYVYFTTLRPQGYRIYSTLNASMWCCVGTGMENHSKYGHFVYTHSGDDVLYVNLFVASTLTDEHFGLQQETVFPYVEGTFTTGPASLKASDGYMQVAQSHLTVTRAGTYTIAIRRPAWAGDGYGILVNGESQQAAVDGATTAGEAGYVQLHRTWAEGDRVDILLPMRLHYEECPGLEDYIAFEYGPILLAAQTTATSSEEAAATGLEYEQLQNEYGLEGRMDHAPGSRASVKELTSAPLLIDASREQTMQRVTAQFADAAAALRFDIDAGSAQSKGSWQHLTLQPFYGIHHARYMCYWYAATPETYADSDMGRADAEAAALAARTIDFVATGEQQSEAGHSYAYSDDSSTGTYQGETYRDAKAGGYVQYVLANTQGLTDGVAVMLRLTVADHGRKGVLSIDGQDVATVTVPSSVKGQDAKGFYNLEVPVEPAMLRRADGRPKETLTVRFRASEGTMLPGLYYLRLVSGYDNHAYNFRATDWVTGDAGRVAQSSISYDTEANTITVLATGANNVALNMDWANLDYTIASQEHYLIVKGTNLSTAAGASYLWWLNGVNRGTQVSPTEVCSDVDGEVVIAWDMNASGLNANNVGDRFSVCAGHTIFGITSTTGTTVISHIGFHESVDGFIRKVPVRMLPAAALHARSIFGTDGRRRSRMESGVNIVGQRKVAVRH